MKKFDGHMHCLLNNDLELSVKGYKQAFALTNTEKGCLMSCPTYLDGDILQNLKQLYFKDTLAPNMYAYGGLYYENFNDKSDKNFYSEDFYTQVKTYWENGFDGIKLLEGKPSERVKIKVMLADSVFDKMFTYLEEKQIPVTLHNSDPASFWDLSKMEPYQIKNGWYCGDSVPPKNELFDDVIAVMDKHPNLKLTLAHFGFTSDEFDQAVKFLSYKNTSLDVCPGGEQYVNITLNLENWCKLISDNAERFKFGTDTENTIYDTDDKKEHLKKRYEHIVRFFATDDEYKNFKGDVKGIKLEQSKLQKILYDNCYNELKEPKPINLNYVKSEIERIEPLLKTDFDKKCMQTIKRWFLNK